MASISTYIHACKMLKKLLEGKHSMGSLQGMSKVSCLTALLMKAGASAPVLASPQTVAETSRLEVCHLLLALKTDSDLAWLLHVHVQYSDADARNGEPQVEELPGV